MKQLKSFLQAMLGLILMAALTVGLVAVFQAMSKAGPAGAPVGTPQGYPPPQATLPVPNVTLSPPLPTAEPWSGPVGVPPDIMTMAAEKARHTPSPSEIAAEATYNYERNQPYPTPPPREPWPSFPVKSLEDIPQVVLNNPYFQKDVNDPTFGPNIKGAVPGTPLLVKSLDPSKRPDYYVVPFFKNGQVNGVAIVDVKDGVGTMGGWSNGEGKQYPPVSAEEAKVLVEETGRQVVGEPLLVYQDLREGTSVFLPFWQLITTDKQTFYVLYTRGIIEVWNVLDVHPLQ